MSKFAITLLTFWSGIALLLFVIWATFASYDELAEPEPISLYRWALSLSIAWLIVMRLRDLWDEDRKRKIGRTIAEEHIATGAAVTEGS